MPIVFQCTLICDSCGRQQPARGNLEPMSLDSIIHPLTGAEPFALEYDRSSGATWSTFAGKAVCSEECKAALFLREVGP